MNRARNAEEVARTCERFVYFIVKITKLYDYQTWQTHFGGNSRGAQRFVGFLSSTAFRMLIGWAGKLQTHGVLSLACGAWAPSGGSCPCPRLSEWKAPGAHACAWGTCKYGYHAYRAGIVTILFNWLLRKSLPSSSQNADDTRSSFVRALGIYCPTRCFPIH